MTSSTLAVKRWPTLDKDEKWQRRRRKDQQKSLFTNGSRNIISNFSPLRSLLVGAILMCLLLPTSSSSSFSDLGCTMRGICHYDGAMYQNCRYNGSPVPISPHREKEYKELCPQLFKDGNFATCCDHRQFAILREQLQSLLRLLSNCPSCSSNFVNFWCQFTCSPHQAHFVDIVHTKSNGNYYNDTIGSTIYDADEYVSKVNYYVSSRYANELLDSCKNVHTSHLSALPIICGKTIEECTPEKLFNNIGSYNKGLQVPFDINVVMLDNDEHQTVVEKRNRVFRPMNTTTYKCSEASDLSDMPCTCLDCPSSCTSSAPFPLLFQESCKIAGMDCKTAMNILAIGVLFGTVMLTVVLHYVLHHYTSEKWDDIAVYSAKELNKLSKVQLEERIVDWCSCYGRFVTQHSLPIFLLGLVPALLASAGLANIRLTTDPVELWSSPGSKAREERDFFNTHFGPFYRIEQMIIVPNNNSHWNRTDPHNFLNNQTLGPVFRKEFLRSVFELYRQVVELKAPVVKADGTLCNVTLNDICLKPLYPQNEHCAVMRRHFHVGLGG